MAGQSQRGPCAQRVYARLGTVPEGWVVTYGTLARAAQVGSARAVGQILRRNPYAPVVPCHRVIRSDLGVGGYQGKTGGAALRHKLHLLAKEGVVFQDGKLAERERLWAFSTNKEKR